MSVKVQPSKLEAERVFVSNFVIALEAVRACARACVCLCVTFVSDKTDAIKYA
jgi:hypothetical protein